MPVKPELEDQSVICSLAEHCLMAATLSQKGIASSKACWHRTPHVPVKLSCAADYCDVIDKVVRCIHD